jgi:hypothetical protein
MPIYVDYHPSAELSVTDIKTFLQAAQRGAADEHGVYPVELFCGDEGHVFCVHVASNEAAVLRRHRTLGLPCREVHQVTALPRGELPRDEDDKAILQQVVARLESQLDDADAPAGDWLEQVV